MQRLMLKMLPILVTSLTPAIFNEANRFVAFLKEQASKTPNEYDDIFVELLDRLINPK